MDRLARDLSADGEQVERDDAGAILLLGGARSGWALPVRLAFTDEQLRRHLLSIGDDAKHVFGDVDAAQAAYQLFLVHLFEQLATSAMDGSRITLGPGGLGVEPVREPGPSSDPDADEK